MKNRILRILKKIIPFSALVFFIWLGINRTDGFRTNLITRFKIVQKDWKIPPSKNFSEITNILAQDFHYLTRGRECFIFESKDKKYVLKFFDSSRYYTKYYFPSVSLPKFLDDYRSKHYNRRRTKLNFNLSSSQLAYLNLKEDAALVYVQLNTSDIFPQKVKVKSKYGKTFSIDLNNVFFILQKKCQIFYKILESSNDEEYKNSLIFSFLEMVDRRTRKLIIDDDIGKKRRNWGIYNNEAVTIDIGRWYFDEKLATPAGYKKEMLKATKILRKYLKENDPDRLNLVNQKLEQYFEKKNNK